MTRHERRQEIEAAIEEAQDADDDDAAVKDLIQHARGSDFALQSILETLGEAGLGVLLATVGRQAEEVEQARLDVDLAAQSVRASARNLEVAESGAARNWKAMHGYWDAIEAVVEIMKPFRDGGLSVNKTREVLTLLDLVAPRDVIARKRAERLQKAREAAGFTEADAPATTQPEENANAI